jgi:hypothetical protein
MNCIRNLGLNGVGRSAVLAGGLQEAVACGARVAVCPMVWEEVAAEEEDEEEQRRAIARLPWFELLVASDVLYDPNIVAPFVRVLARLLRRAPPRLLDADEARGAPSGYGTSSACCAYVATTFRQPATFALFERRAAEAGLRLERLATEGLGQRGAVAFQGARALQDRGGIILHRVTALAGALHHV